MMVNYMKEGGGLTEYARLRYVCSFRTITIVAELFGLSECGCYDDAGRRGGSRSGKQGVWIQELWPYVICVSRIHSSLLSGNFYQEVNLFEALSSSLIYLGEEFSILNLLSRLVQEPTFETP